MSADTFIAIIKANDGTYNGYMRFATSAEDGEYDDGLFLGRLVFCCTTVEEAIVEAQKVYTEYGYQFINLNKE